MSDEHRTSAFLQWIEGYNRAAEIGLRKMVDLFRPIDRSGYSGVDPSRYPQWKPPSECKSAFHEEENETDEPTT